MMLGPVYTLELRQAFRRAGKYPWRWIYVCLLSIESLWLMVGLLEIIVDAFVLVGQRALENPSANNTARLAFFAESLLYILVVQQLLFILLIAPAFAAGSISDEKRRGTLDFLLMSPLSSAEIIVGKWLAQVTQVLHLISPGYFMIALLAGLIGAPAWPLVRAAAEQWVILGAVVAVSLLASTLTRSTVKAIVAVYVLIGVELVAEGMLGLPVFWTFQPYVAFSAGQHRLAIAVLVIVTLASLGLAAWQLRSGHERQQSAVPRVLSRWWDRPPIGDTPMRWKERFIGDWMSVPVWSAAPRWLKCVVIAGLTVAPALAEPSAATFAMLASAQFLLSGLFVGIRCAGAITSEREKQTWDSLITTRIDARQIVRGKLWGHIDAICPFMFAYLLAASVGAVFFDGWALVRIVYAWLASWIFLYYLGAVGIAASAKSDSTWRSILSTLTFGNVYVFVAVGFFVIFIGGVLPGAGLLGSQLCMAAGSIPGLVWLFGQTELVLQQAEQELRRRIHIAQRE